MSRPRATSFFSPDELRQVAEAVAKEEGRRYRDDLESVVGVLEGSSTLYRGPYEARCIESIVYHACSVLAQRAGA